MVLKRVKVDKDVERKLIISLIVSDEACKEILPKIKPEHIEIDYAREVLKWIDEYYKKYKRAPALHIEEIFEQKKDKLKDALANTISMFLESLSEEYEKTEQDGFEAHFWIDQANKYLTKRDVELLIERVNKALDKGLVTSALRHIKFYEGVSVAGLKERLEEVMVPGDEFVNEEIIKPATFIKPWLTHGSLSMIYGPRGLGKTWLAMIIAVSLTRKKSHEIEIGPWQVIRSSGVLFIDGEMDEFMLQERTKILTSALGRDDLDNPLTFLSTHRFAKTHGRSEINLTNVEFRDDIYKFLEKHKEYNVLILDNISSLAGGIDENVKQSWDPINQWLISLRHLGISVIYIHHSGKDPQKQRGTSGREDALDCVINLSRPKVYSPDMGAWFKINFEKSRGVAPGVGLKSFGLRVLEEPNENGLIWEISDVPDKEDNKINLIKGLLLEGGLKGKEIAEMLDYSAARVSQIKSELESSHLLDRRGVCSDKGKKTLKMIRQDLDIDNDKSLVDYLSKN